MTPAPIRLPCLVLLAALLWSLATAQAEARERIALVIGNDDYGAMGRLTNAAADSRRIAAALRAVGFDVTQIEDADLPSMRLAVRGFGRRLRDAGRADALFYFAGHGGQVDGENYLIPARAAIQAEGDIAIESVALNAVVTQMTHANRGANIVVLDACGNLPLRQGSRRLSRGLEAQDAPSGAFVTYGSAPGRLTIDVECGTSPFTRFLANDLGEAGLPIGRLFEKVSRKVALWTDDRQSPWASSSLDGSFAFSGVPAAAGLDDTPAPAPADAPVEREEPAQPAPDPVTRSADLLAAAPKPGPAHGPAGEPPAVADEKPAEAPPRLAARPEPTAPVPIAAPEPKLTCEQVLAGQPSSTRCLEVLEPGWYEISEKCASVVTYASIRDRGVVRRIRLDGGDILGVSEVQRLWYGLDETVCYWVSVKGREGVDEGRRWALGLTADESRAVRVFDRRTSQPAATR